MEMSVFCKGFLFVVLTAVLSTPSLAADLSESSAQEQIRELKKMVIELQQRVRRLEEERSNQQAGQLKAATTVQPVAKEPVPFKSKEPGVAALGSKAPKPLRLGAHEVRVGLDGSVQLDVIHDFNAAGLSPDSGFSREFITADIPVGGPAAKRTNRTGFSPNASCLAGWAEALTPWGPLKVYGKVDLFGSASETEPRIYKAYGTWGWLKGGLDFSLWLNQAAIPDTLDFEGPSAIPGPRFAQASLKIPLQPDTQKRSLFLNLGLEDAAWDVTLPPSVQDVNTSNQIPSIIGKLVYEPDWAAIELAGLYRRLKAQGSGYDQSLNGWGISLSGNIDTWKDDNFIFGILYGEGLGA